jgi:hypothetical protein
MLNSDAKLSASEESRLKKLERNRKSAKMSRARRKDYQGELEQQLEILREENLKLRLLNQSYAERKRRSALSNLNQVNDSLSGRQELYEFLEQKLKSKTTDQEIGQIVTQLKERIVIWSDQRKELIDKMFQSLIDLSFPSYLKYLFWESTQPEGLFQTPAKRGPGRS